SQESVGMRLLSQPKLLEAHVLNGESAIHVSHVGHAPGRPETLGDRGQPWPDARVDALRSDELGPHACFAAEHARDLVRRERAVSREWIGEIHLLRRLHCVEIVRRRENCTETLRYRLTQVLRAAP